MAAVSSCISLFMNSCSKMSALMHVVKIHEKLLKGIKNACIPNIKYVSATLQMLLRMLKLTEGRPSEKKKRRGLKHLSPII